MGNEWKTGMAVIGGVVGEKLAEHHAVISIDWVNAGIGAVAGLVGAWFFVKICDTFKVFG